MKSTFTYYIYNSQNNSIENQPEHKWKYVYVAFKHMSLCKLFL